MKAELLRYHKGGCFFKYLWLCYTWEILLSEEFLLSGFLTWAGKKTLLRGSWYAQRAPGDNLIFQVFWQVLQTQLVCIPRWRLMQTALNLWPFICLLQWVSAFPEKQLQCLRYLKYKTLVQKRGKGLPVLTAKEDQAPSFNWTFSLFHDLFPLLFYGETSIYFTAMTHQILT